MDQNMQTQPEKADSVQAEYNVQKSKQMKKSLIATLVTLIATIAIFSAQTYAFFTDNATLPENRIMAGTLNMELIELQDTDAVERPTTPVHILPGVSFHHGVSVKNTGTLPFYVRIKVEKTILQSENTIPDGWENLISCNFKVDDESTPEIREGLWVYRDGYYYYIVAVDPNSATTPLFDEVMIYADMDNAFTNSEIQVKVICQSVQSRQNSDNQLTAFGWPDEPAVTD